MRSCVVMMGMCSGICGRGAQKENAGQFLELPYATNQG
jgi:hypothetical protein